MKADNHARALKFFSVLLILALAACQSAPPPPAGLKVGNPYAVDGEMYYPEYQPDYDETGMASWYGPGFHGKYTACGEIFNENDLTAAHPTLPMPSLVRVTNLSNGRSLIVRINDRGPFKSHRIIDLSRASARRLGIRSLARVRVQYLKKETEEYLASLQHGGPRVIDMAQYNEDHPPSQIVEHIDSSTYAGQIVDEAAPVVTVSTTDLATPASSRRAGGLIKSAWAADDETPAAAAREAPGFDPPLAKADAAAVHHASLSLMPVASDEGYIVQAGSFASEENARKLASRLSGMASVDRITTGNKSWWRVRLGPFKDRQSAGDALGKARAAGATGAEIIHL